MSKNLTRKGLAFGAIVALGTSLFAGAPAFAADELTLAPSAGTLYKTIEGEAFKLATGQAAAYTGSNIALLKYQVVTSGSVSVLVNTDAATAGAAAAVTAGQPANTTVYSKNASDSAPAAGVPQSITVTSTAAIAAGAPMTATVTSFLDGNANDILDAGEYSSPARTVTWVDATDVTTTTTISPVTSGDTTASATLKFNDINNDQVLLAHVGVNFLKGNGSALANTSSNDVLITSSSTPALTYSTTDGVFKAKTGAIDAVVTTAGSEVNNIVKVVPLYNVAGSAVATDTIGTAVLSNAVKKVVNELGTSVSEAAGVRATASTATTLTIGAKPDAAYTLTATAKDASATPKAVAGATVKVNFSISNGADLSATRTITVNGTTYSTGSNVGADGESMATDLSLTTDASGKVSITVSTVGFVATDAVPFVFTSEGNTNTATVTYTAPAYKIVNEAADATTVGRTVVKGSTYTLNYKVVDQYGDAPSTATTTVYRVVNTVTGASAGTYNATVAADGSASFTFVNASSAAATSTNTLTLKSSRDGFTTTTSETNSGGAGATVVAVVATAAEATANSITLGTVTAGDGQWNTLSTPSHLAVGAVKADAARISSADFANYDFRTSKSIQPTAFKGYTTRTGFTAASNAADGALTLPVTVYDNAGTAIKGLPVTVSGTGLEFTIGTAGSSLVSGNGTLSFLSSASGSNVAIYSHKAGKVTVTVTVGGVTKTKDIYFTSVDGEGVDVVLNAPANVLPGATLTITGSVVDKWGNATNATTATVNGTARKFDAEYDGKGLIFYPSTGAALTATEADGTFKWQILVGTSDSGSGVVTVTYDTNTASTDDVIITKTASIVIGKAPVASSAAKANVVGKTKAFSVSVSGNAAAKNVVVKVAGKTVATLKGSASAKTYTVKATKGSKKVTVYVGGKLIATKTVSVK